MSQTTKSPRQIAIENGLTYYKGGAACKIHGSVQRQTSNGTCQICQMQRHKDWLFESGAQEYPSAYFEGRRNRAKDRPKKPPYSSTTEHFYWWTAGWNDRDIELTNTGKP